MNRYSHIFVWLGRFFHSGGFGIQSPTDFQFDRTVINQHGKYYAYEELGQHDKWLRRKLGLLYFRLANWRQPHVMLDGIGVAEYIKAGCKNTEIMSYSDFSKLERLEMAVLPCVDSVYALFDVCDDDSLIVVEEIKQDKTLWNQLKADQRVTISYDLYYCGLLFFDSKRSKQNYIINF